MQQVAAALSLAVVVVVVVVVVLSPRNCEDYFHPPNHLGGDQLDTGERRAWSRRRPATCCRQAIAHARRAKRPLRKRAAALCGAISCHVETRLPLRPAAS